VKKTARSFVGKFLYGLLFVVLLPAFLFFWASVLDNSVYLPVPDWKPAAVLAVALGGFMVAKGMLDLVIVGKGLPMNPYPPQKFVSVGIYAWFSHPIYFGTGLLAFGLSLWFRSAGALYVLTPVLILALISLVFGYERFAIMRVFGDTARRHKPIFSLRGTIGQASSFNLETVSAIFIIGALYASALFSILGLDLSKNLFLYWLVNLMILILAVNYRSVWAVLRNLSEIIANSRRDWLFFNGKFRIINHGIYSGLAGAVAAGIMGYVIGNNLAVLVLVVCTISGGALFAQLRWGSATLLRPYGYWGAVIGGVLGMLLIKIVFGISIYQTLLAGVLCAPLAQAIGRLRCLSQGCCHGVAAPKDMGIRVWQSQSRVVVLSKMKGECIHATQTYSILFNLWLFSLLFSLWLAPAHNFSASLIVGLYFILTGVERFTEDAYRGEKQTKMAFGMQENQWIAIAALAAGVIITMLPFPPSMNALGALNFYFLGTVLLGGLITSFAMSMDFPRSKVRFSRLSG